MLFSRSAEYGIRAMTYLASQNGGKLSGAREISGAERIPMPFLWKILRLLTQRRLIRSFKGIRGGTELGTPPVKTSPHGRFLATDGREFRENCVLGLPECDNENPCPLHEQWKQIRANMTHMLDHTFLDDLVRVTQRRRRSR